MFKMPKMLDQKDKLMFSYSGLKTHVLKLVASLNGEVDVQRDHICAAFQEEALGQLIRKVKSCILNADENTIKSLLIAGGVAANGRFREMISKELTMKTYFPKLTYCSDNAAMIAALGWHEYTRSTNPTQFKNQHSWDAYSRYRFELVE